MNRYLVVLFLSLFTSLSMASPAHLNVTAISAANGSSILECWQLRAPFTTSTQSGTAGALSLSLGNLANASYSIIPPKFNGGAHNAPSVQYVVFLSGEAKISVLNGTVEATVKGGGKNGLLFAADTRDVSQGGHVTVYPSERETVGLQIPTENGTIPEHEVLYERPCSGDELEE